MVGVAPLIFPDAVRNALMSLNVLYGDSDHDGNFGSSRALQPKATPKGKDTASRGQAEPSNPSRKGKGETFNNYAERRRSSRIQDRFFRKHFGRSRKEQDRVRHMLEHPPPEQLILRREITDGTWKWGPLSSSNDAMLALKQASEPGTRTGTKKA
ncbi:MAG: hypothetical protein L6R39_001043 [Caloplaca ligustica]|nr:MAG: hypothetical protein L6R39_001043 [Caloplaca ligustica]